jgi:hypothetical protein
MTLHRREAAGLLHPLRFNARMMRYRLSEILAIEEAAAESKRSTDGPLDLNPIGAGEIKIKSKGKIKNAGVEASATAEPSTEASSYVV